MRGVEICISPAVSRKPHSTQGRYIERRHKSNREVELERLLHLLPREVVVVVVVGTSKKSEHEIPVRIYPKEPLAQMQGREGKSRVRRRCNWCKLSHLLPYQ